MHWRNPWHVLEYIPMQRSRKKKKTKNKRNRARGVVLRTRMLGREIFPFLFPSIDALDSERAALARNIPEIAASPYFKTWVAQSPLDRMLRAHNASQPAVQMRFGWRLAGF